MILRRIYVDMWQRIIESIVFVQHEISGRTLEFILTSGGVPVNLSDAQVRFYTVKPDGFEIFNDCQIIDAANGIIQYTVTSQTVAVAGTLECFLIIYRDNTMFQTRTRPFYIQVQASPDFAASVESSDEFNALTQALNTVTGLDSRIILLEEADQNNVKLTGNQTISGIKTFDSSPIVPLPTAGGQAVNKSYVDSGFVDLTTDQTIGGTKTFNSMPYLGPDKLQRVGIYLGRGYFIYFAGGALIQWRGSQATASIPANTSAATTVTFPFEFSDATTVAFSAECNSASAGNDHYGVIAYSNTQTTANVRIRNGATAQSFAFSYMAIGAWKTITEQIGP